MARVLLIEMLGVGIESRCVDERKPSQTPCSVRILKDLALAHDADIGRPRVRGLAADLKANLPLHNHVELVGPVGPRARMTLSATCGT
jgi:hypothetical protein